MLHICLSGRRLLIDEELVALVPDVLVNLWNGLCVVIHLMLELFLSHTNALLFQLLHDSLVNQSE